MDKMTKTILAIAMVVSLGKCQNTTFADANVTEVERQKRDFCDKTFVDDRRYNQTVKDYFRSLRSPIYANNVEKAFRYYVTNSSNSWVSAQRWATGLLIVVGCLSFIFWIVTLVFCCSREEGSKDSGVMKSCVLAGWVILFLFAGLLIFISIMIAFSEINHRRTSCQVYSIGSFIIHGHTNPSNGNNFIGLSNYRRILENVQSEASNLPLASDHANSIVNSNVHLWAAGAREALLSVYLANNNNQNKGILGESTQTDIYSTLTRTINPSIGTDFDRLLDTASAQVNTANAVRDLSITTNQIAINPSVNQAKIVLQQMIADVASTNIRFANKAWDRSLYNRGAYWFILGMSIIIICCVAVILCCLGRLWAQTETSDKRLLMKVLLAVAAFFMIWYVICVIFLLVGSTSIATFCTVLANLNDGKTHAIDTLGLQWTNNPRYGLTRAILKECVTGQGDLFQFVYANPALTANWNADVIKSLDHIIKGLVVNKAWVSNPRKTSGSAALANYFNNITLTANGVQEGAAGAVDIISKLNSLTQTNNQAFSPTLAACPSYSNGQACLAADQTVSNIVSSFASGPQFVPHFANLKAYIASESASANDLKTKLSATNTTAQFQYNTANQLIWENQVSWAFITRTVPLTVDSISRLRSSSALFNCQSLRIELAILEDHLCFELNYWVLVLLIIAAVSMLLLFILLWVLYVAIKNAPVPGYIDSVPSPMTKDDPALDIDGKELIPNM
jgi:hypothetical protein